MRAGTSLGLQESGVSIITSVQSTRPHGARPSFLSHDSPIFRFNPRARRGRDGGLAEYGDLLTVSIHAPAGGATIRRAGNRACQCGVSIHAPAGGATLMLSSTSAFSSAVSIHAPAGGATRKNFSRNSRVHRFQSTRPQGARLKQSRRQLSSSCFNPRARRGRDFVTHCRYHLRFRCVSIHAPAGGATHRTDNLCSANRCFNPRARRGRD